MIVQIEEYLSTSSALVFDKRKSKITIMSWVTTGEIKSVVALYL